MSDFIPDVATEIISSIISQCPPEVTTEQVSALTCMEAVRIAALEWSLDSWTKATTPSKPTVFTRMTRSSELAHVSMKEVTLLASEIMRFYNMPNHLSQRVSTLSVRDFVNLLASVHSLGSHFLPSHGRRQKAMRPLGTFYTPSEVTDYIVALAFGPLLTQQAPAVLKDDSSALDRVLSLTILDPACGPGGFLVSSYLHILAFLKNMGIDNNRRILNERFLRNLYGVDLDAAALEVTMVSLCLIAGVSPDKAKTLKLNFKQGDALISRFGLEGTADYSHLLSEEIDWAPFEWREEFPEIFNRTPSGFDVVVMNPPYERLKPNFAEFLRERLTRGSRKIHIKEYGHHRKQLSQLVTYFRRCSDYRLANRYTMDTHRLFVERSLKLLRPGGHLGIIVPTSILGALSSYPLRSYLLYDNSLANVIEFPEAARIFPGVTQAVTILHVIRGMPSEIMSIQTGASSIDSVNLVEPLRVSIADIERVMGHLVKIPLVDSRTWSVMMRLHTHPRLASYPEILNLRGELDLTMDKEFITAQDTGVPLIRGSQVSRFLLTQPDRKKRGYVLFEDFTSSRTQSRRMTHIHRQRIVGQQISNRSQRWRLKFALVEPPCVLANSCNYIIPLKEDRRLLTFLLGVLNSSLLNLRFRIGSTNNHVSNREIGDLPLVNPFADDNSISSVIDAISTKVEQILKSDGDPSLSYEVDGLVFRLYGVEPAGATNVLYALGANDTEVKQVIRHL